jgi:serine/threonine protein phosphatase PrpC
MSAIPLPYGIAERDGRGRPSEDRYAKKDIPELSISMFAIFDGHGGSFTSEYAKDNLLNRIETRIKHKDGTPNTSIDRITELLHECFIAFDQELYVVQSENASASGAVDDSGCTTTVAVITPTHIIVAYIGDSPCILMQRGSGSVLNQIGNHLPSNPIETQRILAAGGKVVDDNGTPRVSGLMISRAFGNFSIKFNKYISDVTQIDWTKLKITPDPDVAVWERKSNTILALCSDGFVETQREDLKTNLEVANDLNAALTIHKNDLEHAAKLAIDRHIETQTVNGKPYDGDDLTLMLIYISPIKKSMKGGYIGTQKKRQTRKHRFSFRMRSRRGCRRSPN